MKAVNFANFVILHFANALLFYSLCFCRKRTHCSTLPFGGLIAFRWNSVVTCWSYACLFLSFYFSITELAANFSDDVWATCMSCRGFLWAEHTQQFYARPQYRCHPAVWQTFSKKKEEKKRRWRVQVWKGFFSHVSISGWVGKFCSALTSRNMRLLGGAWGSFGKYFSEAGSWHRDKTWIHFLFKENTPDGSNYPLTLHTETYVKQNYPVLDPFPERLSTIDSKSNDEPFAFCNNVSRL